MSSKERRKAFVAASMFAGVLLGASGCATAPAAAGAPSPQDPYEGFNRRVFAFNDAVDTAVLKPVAQGYRKVVPEKVRDGVDNVFGNFSDVWSTANQFLQAKPGNGLRMMMRVMVNTTIGLGGLLDPASEMGLDRQSEDFGQTLGRWGMASGPYLVLPLFGPSDIRDTLALPLDRYVTPALLVDTDAQKAGVIALDVVRARADLLDASQMLDDIALDRYSFLRDAYLTRRRSQIYDGNPPDDAGSGPIPRSDSDAPAPAEGAASAPVPPASAAR